MNKPVAWMVDGVLFNSLNAALNISFNIEHTVIPLYTHPVKELTDEEIMEVSKEFNGIPMTSVESWNKVILLFAKAILRKAQEK